jgi:hypothetical protein
MNSTSCESTKRKFREIFLKKKFPRNFRNTILITRTPTDKHCRRIVGQRWHYCFVNVSCFRGNFAEIFFSKKSREIFLTRQSKVPKIKSKVSMCLDKYQFTSRGCRSVQMFVWCPARAGKKSIVSSVSIIYCTLSLVNIISSELAVDSSRTQKYQLKLNCNKFSER